MGTHLLSLKSNLQRKTTTMGAVEKKGRGRPKMTAEQKAAKSAVPKAGRPRTLTDEVRAEREAARKAKIDVRRIPRQGFHLRKDLTDEQKDEIRAIFKRIRIKEMQQRYPVEAVVDQSSLTRRKPLCPKGVERRRSLTRNELNEQKRESMYPLVNLEADLRKPINRQQIMID